MQTLYLLPHLHSAQACRGRGICICHLQDLLPYARLDATASILGTTPTLSQALQRTASPSAQTPSYGR